MSKWTMVGTNALEFGESATIQEKHIKDRKFSNATRNLEKKNEEKLQEEAEKAFLDSEARKESLLAAYKAKKLKSKDAIKEARGAMKKKKINLA